MSAAADESLRIIYPLMWSRLGRKACQEQSINTAAALARLGHQITLLMPKRRNDPVLDAARIREYFQVEGDIKVLQRPARWVGDNAVIGTFLLRQVFHDPQVRASDLILSRMPMLLALGSAAPTPFLLDHYRPWPDDLPIIRRLVRHTSKSAQCLGLIIHSAYAADSYRRAGVAIEKILVAHNGVEPRRMGAALQKDEARARLGLPQDRHIAAYAGRINLRKGLEELLALARLRPEILFLLIGSEGSGPIERMALAYENVRVLPWQEPVNLAPWLYAADILLIPASRAPLEKFRNCVLPLKLFTYLAAGRPIIAPQSPDTAELLEHERTALLVPPSSPSEAAAALDRLLADPHLAAFLGANGRAQAGSLSWDARAQRVTSFMRARLAARAHANSAGSLSLDKE